MCQTGLVRACFFCWKYRHVLVATSINIYIELQSVGTSHWAIIMPSANILEIKFITPGMVVGSGLQYVKSLLTLDTSTWKLGLHISVGQSVVIIQLTRPVVFDIIGFTPFAPISYILTFDWRWCGMFHYQFPGFIGRQSILSTSFSPYCLLTPHDHPSPVTLSDSGSAAKKT